MAPKKKRKRSELWSKKSDYTTVEGKVISMDSSWEVHMARRLDELGVKWIRDPAIKLQYRTKRGRKRYYIPDFFLPEVGLYIEVKGYWTELARHKMRDICRRYPGRICIFESLDAIAAAVNPITPNTGSL